MGPAAQFGGKITHLNNPHTVSVFLPKKRHSPCLFSFLKAHHPGFHRNCLGDLFVYDLLNRIQFFSCHCRKMAEIKPQPVPVHKGTGLLHMGAQHSAQGFLEKMGGAVVFACVASYRLIYLQKDFIAHFEHTFGNPADMPYFSAEKLHGIFHLEFSFRAGDHSGVSALAAHGGIKRRLLHNNGSRLPVCKGIHQLCFCGQHCDP